jgi:5-methyltetrahydrofolate--homocysteine methyltransferase
MGLPVIDLGKDVLIESIIQEAVKQKTNVVGLSTLMVTTMVEMPEIIRAVEEVGSHVKVGAGGAVVTKKYAREIGADGYAKDDVEAVEIFKKLVGEKVTIE